MSDGHVLLIAGASARAAAFSALRGGFAVCAADLFADADLRRACSCSSLDPYPDQLAEILQTAPPGDWMYTGALENHPQLLALLETQRRLLGCTARVVRQVRDPQQLHESLTRGGFASPTLLTQGAPPTDARRWLRKQKRSAGGLGVAFLGCDEQANLPSHEESRYVQEFLSGVNCGLAYVASGGRAHFLGASWQLVGRRWCGARPFMYSGSLAPLPLKENVRNEAVRLGAYLANAFQLTGLFGVDAILQDGRLWVLEVNPRFTSSLEVFERIGNFSAVGLHVQACQEGRLPAKAPSNQERISGKAVVYARCDALAGAAFQQFAQHRLAASQVDLPKIADIPPPGSRLFKGRPICTVLADGTSLRTVVRKLRTAAAGVFAAVAN